MRESKVKPLTRKQFDDRETFDATTPNLKVQADFVNTYVAPPPPIHYGVDPDVAAFNFAMQGIEEGLKGGARIKKQIDEDRTKRGMTDAAAKKERQEDSEAYIRGHEIISGRAAANDLEAAMDEYFESAKDETPDKFKAGLDSLSRKFLAGRSPEFVEGLLGEAIHLEQKYGSKYMAHVKMKTKEMGHETIGSAFQYELRQVLDTPVDANDSDFRAKVIREMVRGAGDLGKNYGLSRTEVSERLVQIIGRQGMKLADPELLMKVANVPDQDGIRLIDNPELAPHIERLHHAARIERDKVNNELEKRVRQAQNDVEATVSNKILVLSLDFNANTREAHDLLIAYSDPKLNPEGVVLNPGFVATAHKLIANRGRGFATESNPKVYALAIEKAGRGEMTTEDALALKGSLDEGDWKQIVGLAMREREARGGSATRVRKDFDRDLAQSLKIVGAVDPFTGRWLDRNGPARQAWVAHRARSWYAGFEGSQKREPSHEEYFAQLQKLQAESFLALKELPEEGVSEGELQAIKPIDPKKTQQSTPQSTGREMRKTTDSDVRSRIEKMKQQRQKQN